ncbi:MAG: PAS domain-containing protein [Myxococcota bacterium]|nr:PAS domain-containing protein [Myxococcota bacterium]
MGGPEARRIATWLVRERGAIEAALGAQGRTLPPASSPEAEALRRFRSFVTSGLLQGPEVAPSLEGLRARERRLAPLLSAWTAAAVAHAGAAGPMVKDALEPLRERFLLALRGTAPARRAGGAPTRSARRAVPSAIDRVTDAFLAVDTDGGTIEDANPAAAALLGTTREALLGQSALGFVPESEQDRWWTELDAMAEGSEPRRLAASLRASSGDELRVEVSITRWSTRRRTLALVLARPTA